MPSSASVSEFDRALRTRLPFEGEGGRKLLHTETFLEREVPVSLKIILFATLLFSHPAFAVEGQSETTEAVRHHSVTDDVYLNYFGIFHGPGVTNLGSPYTPDARTGKAPVNSPINLMSFDSELTAAYMLTPHHWDRPGNAIFSLPRDGSGFFNRRCGLESL